MIKLKVTRSLVVLVILCSLMTSCNRHSLVEVKKIEEANNSFEDGVNKFSLRMFKELEDGENIFISPYSIAMALSLVDNGAKEDTKKEIERVLGIEDLDTWNKDVGLYLNKEWSKQTFLKNANSLWISNQIKLAPKSEEEYFSVVYKYLKAEKYYMDLNTIETKDKINKWVNDNTNGMIKNILDYTLDNSIKMALLNAIYFEGKWENPFYNNNTEKCIFYGKDKETEVDMMKLEGKRFKYIEKRGLSAVELPYKNSNIVMDIILNKDKDNKEVYNSFCKLSESEQLDFLKELSESSSKDIDTLCIPKFETEYSERIKIKSALQSLGIQSAFKGSANFSKISNDNLYIGDIIHKAKIEVEENGTKASATTAIFAKDDLAVAAEEPFVFIADNPFLYIIRDTEKEIILFIGVMNNM